MALKGVRVLELAGLAPAPFAGMCLADNGAEVIRVDRILNGQVQNKVSDVLCRGRKSIAIDLQSAEGKKIFKCLVKSADVLIEPFRPGVMEKLGLGPDDLMQINSRLVYARLTGFGQGGESNCSQAAGHDINYLAQSGILSALRRKDQKPTPPMNLLGDFAGGGLICAFGIMLALFERVKSGKGQVVDAAMVDGVAYLSSMIVMFSQFGLHGNSLESVGTNLLDSGAHFYDTYECADGQFFSVGAIEPKFYLNLLRKLDFDEMNLPKQMDQTSWPKMKMLFAAKFKTKTRNEWSAIFKHEEACAFPVLSIEEAMQNEHNQKRNTFAKSEQFPNLNEVTAAPKLSRSKSVEIKRFPKPGEHTFEVLSELGFSNDKIISLAQVSVIPHRAKL